MARELYEDGRRGKATDNIESEAKTSAGDISMSVQPADCPTSSTTSTVRPRHFLKSFLPHTNSNSLPRFLTFTFPSTMKFSQTCIVSILALANTAVSLPTAEKMDLIARDPMAVVERSAEAEPALQKRILPAIALGKILLGQALAGVAKAGVDAAKAHLEDGMIPENDHDDFDSARDYFMRNAPKDLFDKRADGVVGIACINGPYTLNDNAKCAVAFKLEFKWDMYNTDYDCMEMYPGSSVVNHGDGGYMNVGYYGSCKFEGKTYTC
ncbi:unnamed protein product [Cercospora beticola]|nr:unnamed protein product [Cercospora beticola]